MTWKELRDLLNKQPAEALTTDVTVFDSVYNEFYPGIDLQNADDSCDVLDEGHLYIKI